MINFLKKLAQILSRNYLIQLLLNTIKLPSAILLIIANLIPVIGVIFFKWNPYDILLLYWIENIVIGLYNVPRILRAKGNQFPDNGASVYKQSITTVTINGKTTTTVDNNPELPSFNRKDSAKHLAFFFIVHYGLFTLGHGVFLIQFISNKSSFLINNDYWGLLAFLTALVISHGYSYLSNYIGKQEYNFRSPTRQMFTPYGRILITHVIILVGAIAANMLPTTIIIIFISIKLITDLLIHLNTHTKYE